jgi:hypothetical protein
MNAVDFVLGPIYFLLIYLWAKSYSSKLGSPFLGKHFLNGILFKLVGATGASIVYWYVFGTGDSIYYYNRSIILKHILFEDFNAWFQLIFSSAENYDSEAYGYGELLKASDASTFLLVKILSIVELVCFDSYLCGSYIFALLSFYGVWKVFLFFNELYPQQKDKLAIAFLYIPSVAFWGSGIFKDNITYGFLCLLIVSLYNLLIYRRNIFRNFLFVVASVYVIGIINSYILMAFLPSFGVWLFLEYRQKISSSFLRTVSTPLFLALSVVAGLFVLQTLGKTFSKFSVDNFETKASGMQRWHTQRVEQKGEGSSYSLGTIDFSPTGMIKTAPLAIFVSIYRPFLWEARNPIMLLSALESLFFLIYTLRLLPYFLSKPGRAFGVLMDNPSLVFCIIFSLIFAFSVGFTSYNFGALSRYRIPLLPFYMTFVYILIEKLSATKQVFNKQIA